MARLHYLTWSRHARTAARDAGLTVTDRAINAWLTGRRQPSRASLQQIETAYRMVRRQNVARYLLRRLKGGGGTRVEIHPFNQSQVDRRFQRVVPYRTLNVHHWDRIVGYGPTAMKGHWTMPGSVTRWKTSAPNGVSMSS